MAEEVLVAAANAGKPVHPGQQPSVLQRLERHAHTVAVTPGGRGKPVVAREAPAAAVGIVEAPQERSEHAEARPGQRSLVLAGLPIRVVVGVGGGPDAGLGIPVETMRRRRAEYFLAPSSQMTRQNKLQAVLSARIRHRPFLSAEILRLTRQ